MVYFKKKLLVVLLLSLFFIFCVSSSSNASTGVYDVEQLIVDQYEQTEIQFCVWAENYIENNGGPDNTSNQNIAYIIEILSRVRAGDYIYFDRRNSATNQSMLNGGIDLIVYHGTTTNITWTNDFTFTSYNTNDNYSNCTGCYFTGVSWYVLKPNNEIQLITQSTGGGYPIFRAIYKKYDNVLNNLVSKYIPSSYTTVETQEVTVVGMDNYMRTIFSLFDRQHNDEEEQNDLLESIKQGIANTNSFLNNDNVDNSSYDMPNQNDTNDISGDGLNNIFNLFYSKITSDYGTKNIHIPIPFTNRGFDIPNNLTENIVSSFANGTLKTLLGLIWWYVLSVYIIKDVTKYIDNMKTGEILTKSDTNVKTEML